MSNITTHSSSVEHETDSELTLWGRVVWVGSRLGVWLVIGLMVLVSSPFLLYSWLLDNEPDRYQGGQP